MGNGKLSQQVYSKPSRSSETYHFSITQEHNFWVDGGMWPRVGLHMWKLSQRACDKETWLAESIHDQPLYIRSCYGCGFDPEWWNRMGPSNLLRKSAIDLMWTQVFTFWEISRGLIIFLYKIQALSFIKSPSNYSPVWPRKVKTSYPANITNWEEDRIR
jgi:hypothetical protein